VVQDAFEVGRDPALRANGMIAGLTDADGVARELVCSPVQFDEQAPNLRRAPAFAEHTDEVIRECGFTDDELIQLKIGPAALRFVHRYTDGGWTGTYLYSLADSIGGGTSQIQRNIIGERLLGLPR